MEKQHRPSGNKLDEVLSSPRERLSAHHTGDGIYPEDSELANALSFLTLMINCRPANRGVSESRINQTTTRRNQKEKS
ncbi:MAG TPA: hypothetical protein DHV36_18540 [Desulfobacteraceae bacterium]|nr:hypothetical protein [Desulfobacteraceae bacterium]|tara:strand:+ start:125 stop:358 length:234 start_codon:yes stop_codon:yes gene_type:complete